MAEDPSPLESEVRRLIAIAGPMRIADYMQLCLTHPMHGYYINRDPLGAGGDFVTSPEISQMFGELIGLWMGAVWQQMGAPENVRVIELGPGRGTLMQDALRAARVAGRFRAALVVHLVEISPALRQAQERRLEGLDVPIFWHAALKDVPGGPAIVVANEFIDALPVHQAVKAADGWHERLINIGADDNLVIVPAADPLPHFEASMPRSLRQSAIGSIYEWRSDRTALELGRRVRSDGAALVIDYGHANCGLGETLQAVSGHAAADPLRAPGLVDLTAHVDFEALAQSAGIIGARIHWPLAQREFLLRLGIEQRATVLKASASPDQIVEIEAAYARLTGAEAGGMGELFKAIAIADPKLGTLPGFGAAP
jgi:NADH dehydrogenase [ubiquinone] 1 alpha subcomplex assembly factor 7